MILSAFYYACSCNPIKLTAFFKDMEMRCPLCLCLHDPVPPPLRNSKYIYSIIKQSFKVTSIGYSNNESWFTHEYRQALV